MDLYLRLFDWSSTMDKFIDVRRMIAAKNPRLLKWLPGFIIRYVERIIHQEDINAFMIKHKEASAYEFCKACMEEFEIELNLKGKENIIRPPESCVFVGNHPLGGFDAVALISSIDDVRPDLRFIVNDFLLSVENLRSRFVGVNKVGRNARESLKAVENQFADDTATFIFPAGLVSRKQNGIIRDLEWSKTFVSKAKKYKKPVIPVYIEGRLTNRFYRLANIRKALRIKLNIEMFFLVDELFRQKNTKMDIIIGEPVPPETFDKTRSEKEWAEWMKEKVYQLKQS
ncbi:glycerol acyltransferase [Roseivirga sp.]|uniref:glycerol acyltransferase n=1 Tax=Roseivirga sp. TaxID=1964215 RepID=UPI003B52B539